MSVNLSPLGGAGAQFFTNDGVPLTGGLLYTYQAGTTTPATTYTSGTGLTALANPIILDAAGRVPTGEIWLTDGVSYKFVLKDSTDVLIATWDGLSGINSNFIAFTAQEETATATAGQTVFNLTLNYVPATNNLAVFVNGSNQVVNVNYTETDDNTVTFLTGLNVGDVVKFSTATPVATNAMDAANVSYAPAGVDAVTTNVQAKLRQTVSVKDFGATGDGATDDTTAVQNAFDYIDSVGGTLYFPRGTYLVSTITQSISTSGHYPVNISGEGQKVSIIKKLGTDTNPILSFTSTASYFGGLHHIADITIEGNNQASNHAGILFTIWANLTMSNVNVFKCYIGVQGAGLLSSTFLNCEIANGGQGYRIDNSGSIYANAIKIIGGRINFNSQRAINFDFGSGLHLYGVNIEGNGTAGNINYGGIFIGGNVSAETGVSEFSFDGCWIEGNYGTSFKVAALVTGTIAPVIAITNSTIFVGESIGGVGYAVTILQAATVTIENSLILGLNVATTDVTAGYLAMKNCVISLLNNSSTTYKISGVKGYLGDINTEMAGGVKTGVASAAGFVGELISSTVASASPVSLSTGAWTTVTSIQLTPGIWDVSSMVGLALAGSTTLTNFSSSISSATNNAGVETSRTNTNFTGVVPSIVPSQANPVVRYNVSVNTNVYLTTNVAFAVSTASAFGIIRANRVA